MMLSILKEMTVYTFTLALSAPFVCLILLQNLFFLSLESHQQMTILQFIPRAYIDKIIVCNNHDLWTLIEEQLITEYLGTLSMYLICFQSL